MVTTERPTPSADGAAPPTIACAGAANSSAEPASTGIRIFIGAQLPAAPPLIESGMFVRAARREHRGAHPEACGSAAAAERYHLTLGLIVLADEQRAAREPDFLIGK